VIHVGSPRTADQRGRTRLVDHDAWVRSLVEAVLFTAPGERVNNPRFGVGLDRTVFEALDELTIAAVEFRIAEGMRRELGDEAVIDAVRVEIDPDNGQVLISIDYERVSDRSHRNLEIVV
jgi:uncharacterized protein